MLHCKFSGDCNSERIFKIGRYLTKLYVEHLGFTFLAHHVGGAEDGKERRHLSTRVRDVSHPVQPDNFRSRLRSADSTDWQLSCTRTAEVVHQLTKWPRIYAEYHADGPQLSVDRRGADSITFCLERRFRWTGLAETHVPSTSSRTVRNVVACHPEVVNLIAGINATNAVYLAVHGAPRSVADALKCIPLDELPVYVVTAECYDDVTTSAARSVGSRLGRIRAVSDGQRCEDALARPRWFLYYETQREMVFVRRRH